MSSQPAALQLLVNDTYIYQEAIKLSVQNSAEVASTVWKQLKVCATPFVFSHLFVAQLSAIGSIIARSKINNMVFFCLFFIRQLS